jgi:hypothetical protein
VNCPNHELRIASYGIGGNDGNVNLQRSNGVLDNFGNVFDDVPSWTQKVGMAHNFVCSLEVAHHK